MTDEPLSEREISDMNTIIKPINASGSLDLLAQLKAITGTWPPSAKAQEKFKAEKAESNYQSEKHAFECREIRMAKLNERARQAIQRNRDGLI